MAASDNGLTELTMSECDGRSPRIAEGAAQVPRPATRAFPLMEAPLIITWVRRNQRRMKAPRQSRCTRGSAFSVQNKCPDQINNFTSDQEQYRPYQIVDLLLKIGHSLRSFLRLRREDGSQEENDGDRSQDYPNQLVHNAMSLRLNLTTIANLMLGERD
jgi:hypothetical protein